MKIVEKRLGCKNLIFLIQYRTIQSVCPSVSVIHLSVHLSVCPFVFVSFYKHRSSNVSKTQILNSNLQLKTTKFVIKCNRSISVICDQWNLSMTGSAMTFLSSLGNQYHISASMLSSWFEQMSQLMRLCHCSSAIKSFFNAHAQPSSGARCLIFGQILCLLPNFMCANSEDLCDKYHNLMSWLKLSLL